MKKYFQIPFANVPPHPDYDVWYAGWNEARPVDLTGGVPPLVIGVTDGELPDGAETLATAPAEKTPPPPPPPLAPGGLAEYKTALPDYLASVMADSPVRHTYFVISFDRAAKLPAGCTAFYSTWTKERPQKLPPHMPAPWVIGAAAADRLPPAARPLADKVVQNPPSPPPPGGGSEDYQEAFGRWIASLPGA